MATIFTHCVFNLIGQVRSVFENCHLNVSTWMNSTPDAVDMNISVKRTLSEIVSDVVPRGSVGHGSTVFISVMAGMLGCHKSACQRSRFPIPQLSDSWACWADIVVFDSDTVKTHARHGDPKHYPVGIDYVIVNGQVVIDNGENTGALPCRGLGRGRGTT